MRVENKFPHEYPRQIDSVHWWCFETQLGIRQLDITRKEFVERMLNRFCLNLSSEIHATPGVELGPRKDGNPTWAYASYLKMPPHNMCFYAYIICMMLFWEGVAESGLSSFLYQVPDAGNVFHQELVDAYPQVRTMDVYSLNAVGSTMAEA